MKQRIIILTILLFSFCSTVLSQKPNIRFTFSEEVEYCENCREHSMDGWIIKFRLENLSDKPVSISGVWFPDSDGKKHTDSKYFFPSAFSQALKVSNCEWLYDGLNEKPAWAKKTFYLKDERLNLDSLASYESALALGWNFDSYKIRREVFVVSFEDNKEFYEIESPPYSLVRNQTNDSVKLFVVPNPCENDYR